MRWMFLVTATLIFFIYSPGVQAQQSELIDRTISGVSISKTPLEARREIQDKASQKVSRRDYQRIDW